MKNKCPIFAKVKNRTEVQRVRGGIAFHWSRRGIGWGTLTLRVTRGKLDVDNECMGPAFCASVVRQAIEQSIHD
jgi:hypothetical protein